ncbi:MAG: CehA/McbA family metallohydrolase [Planctomycetaceae bacterium]|nr:CehA/McbA family metallohydrolase [Planctomycetaceae bacterium]
MKNAAVWQVLILVTSISSPSSALFGQDQLPLVMSVERQPLTAATKRIIEAMEFAGAPIDVATLAKLDQAFAADRDADAIEQIQKALDPLCVAMVNINAESRVKVSEGPAPKELIEQGWTAFLVKVHNEAGINPPLQVESPNAAPVYQQGKGARQQPRTDQNLVDAKDVPDRFLDLRMLTREPLKPRLSGLALEYAVVELYSRDAGKREAAISFHVGAGTQDIGFRNAVPMLFECKPAVEVKFSIRDSDGSPTTASLIIRDTQGRIYPHPSRRLAPDFFFHHQIYRNDGESVALPPGRYEVIANRGPEYLPQISSVEIPADVKEFGVPIRLKRWIHLASRGWYSGDHHVHAAGCAHYDSPTEGVGPEDMMRHILGEDLNVGCVLSWGPCWYTQKQFFEGEVSRLSTNRYLMRYDVEVSGFPSSHAGHLCLLKLREDDFPGTTRIEQWPSWTMPVLQWGQRQGGIVGYSHSGWGLALPDYMPDGSRQFTKRPWGGAGNEWPGRAADRLPDYAMPVFDGIGANEYIVTTAHGACDFISAVDTPAIWELNIWYHTLNCGMTSRISGETDFPCIYGDRVGLGRIYVGFDDDEELSYDTWVDGLKDGRSYCGDGLSHIIDFKVDDVSVGARSADQSSVSELQISEARSVVVQFDAAALLEETPTELSRSIRNRRLDEKPYWHIERCRIDDSRDVPVEIIINGEVAATRRLLADGHIEHFEVPVEISRSSWIAIRILPSVHTNPIFVKVDGKPIRASQRSAEWCIQAVDTCWNSKKGQIRESEKADAKAAYDAAREIYQQILTETTAQ